MTRYIVRRVLIAIPLLIVITLCLYYLIYQVGDPLSHLVQNPRTTSADIARIKHRYHLDLPIWQQYLYWLGNLLHGDWGNSFVTQQSVFSTILSRLGNTLILMVTALVITLVISIPIGLLSALKQYSIFDYIMTGLSFLFYSLPVFFLGFMLIWIFSLNFQAWGLPALPSGKMYDVRTGKTIGAIAQHVILPAFTIALISSATYVRYLRASVLEVLGQDYIRTARSKGIRQAIIVRRHVLRNAALPLITITFIQIAFLFSGAVVTETIFAWPGMGLLFIQSADTVDYPMLMGILTISSALIIIFNLLADIAYAYIDPRIKYS